MPQSLRNFVDSVFSPPLTFLQLARSYLNNASVVAGHGINLNNYLGFFGYLPPSMQAVINSLLAAVVLLAVLLLVKTILRMYYAFKDATQWW